jgi:hypothetical protein
MGVDLGQEIGVFGLEWKTALGLAFAATACCVAPDIALAAEPASAALVDQAEAILVSAPVPAAFPLLATALLCFAYLTRSRRD